MQGTNHIHPIRRVREAFKNTPEAAGLRDFHTSGGFALLIGRAPSSIRNAESGQTKKWDRLARQIENKTGVSSVWLLGNPEPSEPILGVDGTPWDPERYLDHLGGGQINWRFLMNNSPRGTVKLATRMVELKLRRDLIELPDDGNTRPNAFLAELAQLLERHHCLEGKEAEALVVETFIDDTQTLVADLVQAATRTR